jgi:lysine biosynthesis protein LysW
VDLIDVTEDELVVCPRCGSDLEVTRVSPLTLAPAPAEVEE